MGTAVRDGLTVESIGGLAEVAKDTIGEMKRSKPGPLRTAEPPKNNVHNGHVLYDKKPLSAIHEKSEGSISKTTQPNEVYHETGWGHYEKSAFINVDKTPGGTSLATCEAPKGGGEGGSVGYHWRTSPLSELTKSERTSNRGTSRHHIRWHRQKLQSW